jgi:hypothetical protein
MINILFIRQILLYLVPIWYNNGINMPAITLKNIPEDLYAKIKKSAEINFRSINSEILFRLRSSLYQQRPEIGDLLSQIHAINRRIKIPILNDNFIESAKNEGRM